MTKKKRKYRNVFECKATTERGGGSTNVEERKSMGVAEMWMRMMRTGEIREAMKLKSNNHGSIERADALINNAKEPPAYMRTGDHFDTLNKMGEVDKKIKAHVKAKKKNELIDKAVKAKLKNINDETV
jgi:hypothetical protein